MTVTHPDNTPRGRGARSAAGRRARRATPLLATAITLPLVLAPVGMQGATAVGATVDTSDDTYTTSTRPTYNAGDRHKVAVGQDRGAEKVGYFKFELPSGELADPYLLLTVQGGTAGTVRVHATGTDWTDRGLTPQNAPTLGQRVGEVSVSGSPETVRIPLELELGSGPDVAVAVTRTDGGLSRIVSREQPGSSAAQLGFAGTVTGPAVGPAPAPRPTPPPAGDRPPVERTDTSKLPIFASPAPDSGSYIESYEARRADGWGSAFFTYWPGEMTWNAEWAAFVARYPEGVPVIGSPKGVNPANVRGFLDKLPQAWRDKFTVAYFQEPEDDFTTSAQRAQFRQKVAQMADLVRPYGVANAVHLQEWTINPYNNKSWGGEKVASEFFNPEDVDAISWSLFPAEGRSMRDGIDRIKAFTQKYAPRATWGITSAGSPVSGSAPIGGTARARRAEIVRDGAEYTARVGGQSFGWFDWDEYNPGRDQLAAKDPALTRALRAAAQVERTEPEA